MATVAEVELALIHLKVGTMSAVIVESGDAYVQAADRPGDVFAIEAVSDEFRETPLTPDQLRRLEDFGFRPPAKGGSPNHWQHVARDPNAVATLLLDVLTTVYAVDAATAGVVEVS